MFGAEQKTLEEIRALMIHNKKREVIDLSNELVQREKDRVSAAKMFAALDRKERGPGVVHTRNRQSRKETLAKMDEEIEEKKKQIARTKALVGYFESISPKADGIPSECTICLDKIAGESRLALLFVPSTDSVLRMCGVRMRRPHYHQLRAFVLSAMHSASRRGARKVPELVSF